ncbi:MAG: histidinol dehydrogenase [Acidobacteriota bacterium]|nr:histidinol dehydrogenase [Acidobacteriota bacterium]
MIEVIRQEEGERRTRKLAQIAARNVALDAGLMETVAAIIMDVRERGDAALIEYTERFDGVRLEPHELRVSERTLRESAARAEQNVVRALREAIKRVREFHEHEREESWEIETTEGVRLGQRLMPLERAGLYVPGGTASYPSSVVMNVVPAQVAGVERLVVVTPPRTLSENPVVAAALVELNVTEVYSVGGAQAIAALAYGTETLPRVDKITGPGNKYVASAKRLVFGAVGIDSIAGPSEVVIIADETARAEFVAADLLAQAEHDEEASAILITTSEALAVEVAVQVERQTRSLSRRAVIEKSLAAFGAIIVVNDLDEACELVNKLAPEHLEIITRDEDAVAARVRHAGAIFLGAHTPEAVGDYFAGPNHVLPTGGAARYSSALGVYDFVRRTTMLRYSPDELARTAHSIAVLATSEGLDAHARSALVRVKDSLESGVWSLESKAKNSSLPSDSRLGNLETIKPRVRELRAYTLTPDRASVKINQNENPWDAPARIKEESLRRLSERAWSRYPDFVPANLHERLAGFAGWRADGVIAGNGSNELIQALLMVTVGEAKRVLICEPTFALYRQVTTVLGGEVLSVPLDDELKFDAAALMKVVREFEPEVTILCSPNNPTGCRISDSDLAALLETSSGLVVVDEAYFEFSGHTVAPLLRQHRNLAVFRTFSKAMALAGLRIGYLLAAPELTREVGKAVLPYNLNVVSQTVAEVALEMYEAELKPLVERIIKERERLYVEMKKIEGLQPAPSQANFMVVRSRLEPGFVFRELLRRDILIRDVSKYPLLKDYFRASVGTPAENDLLLAALREIFTERQNPESRIQKPE